MKLENKLQAISIKASADILAKRFIGTDGNYAAQGTAAVGTSDVETNSGFMMPVNTYGVVLVEAESAIPVGSKVSSGISLGKAKAYEAGEESNGIALDEATQDGDLIRIVIR